MKISYYILMIFGLSIGVFIAFQKKKSSTFYPVKKDLFIYSKTTNLSKSNNFNPVEQDSLFKKGRRLFLFNCATCHNKNMKDNSTGPALGGVRERWKGREALLYEFIRNSQAVIHTKKDKYAIALYKKWHKSIMNSYPKMTNKKIDALLIYIDEMYQQ